MGGLPLPHDSSPGLLPRLNGMNSVDSPARRVVMYTRLGSTAKWTTARRFSMALAGSSRSFWYWVMA